MVGVILIILSLLSYVGYQLFVAQTHTTKVDLDKKIASHYGTTVLIQRNGSLYQKGKGTFQKVGTFSKEFPVKLEKIEGKMPEYFPIASSSYYVFYEDVKKTDEENQPKTFSHYVPYAKTVVSKKDAVLMNEEGESVFTLQKTMKKPLLVQDTNQYGFVFLDQLLYVKTEDATVEEQKTDLASVASELPVLMYHFFYSETDGSKAYDSNYVSQQRLEEQLQYLTSEGYYGATMHDVALFVQGKIQLPKKTVAITIDDGSPTVYPYAYPLFQKYQFPATMFLITSWVSNGETLTDPQLMEMEKSPYIDFQSHSHNMHRGGCSTGHKGIFQCISETEGIQDLETSARIVKSTDAFCYPFGDYNEQEAMMLKKAGYLTAYTTQAGKVRPGMDPYSLPRVRISTGTSLQSFIQMIQ